MGSRRQLWLVDPRLVALFAAMMIVIGWNTKTRADNVLVSLYSFGGSSTVDLIDPATGKDTGAYISGLNSPSGIAIGTDGTIYVAEQGSAPDVRHYTASGSYINTIASSTVETPNEAPLSVGGVRVGPNGNVYATDFGAQSRPPNLSDTALFQYNGATGSFVNSAVSGLSSATGMAFDNAGNVFVADYGDGQVVKYNSTTQTQATIITGGSGPSNSPLSGPSGLLLLPNGNLLVGDLNQSNMLEYTTSGTYVAPFVLGSNQSAVSFPSGLQFTPNGQDILVANLGADFVHGSVSEFDLNGKLLNNWTTGLASDVAVLATPAVTWSGASSNYSNGSNWSSSSAPNLAGANATFGAGIGSLGPTATVTIDGQFTVGTLAFNNASTKYVLQSAADTSSITLNNNGLGGVVSVPAGGQIHTINSQLILSDIGSTGFNIGSGSTLNIGAPITGSGTLALTGGGSLVIGSGGSIAIGGGTTIENGQLKIGPSGSISGPVMLIVAYGYNGELDLAAPSTSLSSLTSSTDSVAGTTATVNVAANSTLTTPALSVTGALNFNSAAPSNGLVAISGAPTLAAGSELNLHAGTLSVNITNGSTASIGSGASVAVAAGATLQLAGSVSPFSDGSAIIPSSGNVATVANSGTLQVTGSNQSVGVVTGSVTSAMGSPTTYDGDTVVGDGMSAASLTATQILQHTLTIDAGSTVTINPSGANIVAMDSSASATAEVAPADVESSSDSDGDFLAAIQAAISSGAISSEKGEPLENRIAAIERLETTDPGLDVSLLENRILAALPSPSLWSGSPSPLDEPTSGLLDADISASDSTSSQGIASAAFSSGGGLGAGPTAVPEPPGLLLAAVGCIGLATIARRRKIIRQIATASPTAWLCYRNGVGLTANCSTFP
jgi:fibronectin-binding autotransporter adhesin